MKYSGNIHISFLNPIMPGLEKKEFVSKLESEIYSETEKFY